MNTYADELRMFKKWMRGKSFDTLEELAALVIFGNYGYEDAVKRINAVLRAVDLQVNDTRIEDAKDI